MISCKSCKDEMPELRLTKFGYETCVDCSTIGAYKAVTTINGSGDHTWNDIQIMTPEQHANLEKNEKKSIKWDSYTDE